MPTQTSAQDQLRDNAVAFNILLGAARNMVARLVMGGQRPITSGTVLAETTNFQNLFNETRFVVFDELADIAQDKWQPATLALELRQKGMTADGKYGPRTSTALALVMWAQSGKLEAITEIGGSVPSNPSSFPQQYLAKKTLFDETLREVPVPQGTFEAPPAPVQQPPAQVATTAEQGGLSVTQPPGVAIPIPVSMPASPTQVMQFENQTVVGQGKGKSSFGMVLAGLLGLSALAGILIYATRKKRFA